MRKFTLEACQSVQKLIDRKAVDHWALFDSPSELGEYAKQNCMASDNMTRRSYDFFGTDTGLQAVKKTREGDIALVAKSDALLERFERFAFDTSCKGWADDVAGAIPNVPAYLAGHPNAMRRRVTYRDAGAPLAVIVDLTTSCSITADAIERRGAAVMALVRLLAMKRPVELWAGVMVDANTRKDCAAVFTKIETAPLDLATAAYVLTSASFPRRLCYAYADTRHYYSGSWPYNNHKATRQLLADICKPAFHHVTEALCIPAIHVEDQIANDPEGWIEAKLAELTPVDLAA